MTGPAFHITVATTPGPRLSLAPDVALVKAALLYADKVTLSSGTAAMIDAAVLLLAGGENERSRRFMEVASVLMEPETRALLTVIQSRKFRRRFHAHDRLETAVLPSVAEVERVVESLARDSGLAELDAARSAGLLQVDTLGLDPIESVQDAVLVASGRPSRLRDDIVGALVRRMSDAATIGSGTYPLFDEGASGLVSAMIREGALKNPAIRPAGQSALAVHFIGYVPAFPDATVAEIVDVRRGLEVPLVRFRGAVVDMARSLETAPWDIGFRQEADDFWRVRVAPALSDLEENARDRGVLSLLRHAVLSPAPWAAGGAAVAIAVSSATVLPDLAALALSVGAPAAAAAAAGAEATKERRRLERVAERNQCLFLYQADNDLSERAHR